MKVISGTLKGRVIEGYHLEGTRPTMDRVKESLFAMIQEKVKDSTCLDLFSGSGNLGIEAISEGASKVYFVDANKKATMVIKKNIEKFGLKEKATLLSTDYKKALEMLREEKFDIIFLDPPYQTNYIEDAIQLINQYEILKKDGIIVCESDQKERIVFNESYQIYKERKYGDKQIVILEKI